MTKKWPKEIVYNYAYGLDIAGFDIIELEQDDNFIFEVLKLTKDKKYYHFLSNNGKKDLNVLKYMIKQFKDIDFIKDYLDSYIKEVHEDETNTVEFIELIFLLAELAPKKSILATNNFKDYYKYGLLRESIYTYDKAKITVEIDNNPDDFGLGFVFILESYKTYKVIVDYYAKRFLCEIFDGNLEELVHKKFKSFDKLEEIGNIPFLLKYIESKDVCLKDYLMNNLHLLDELSHNIDIIKINWDNYIKRINEQKCAFIYQKVNEFMEDNMGYYFFDCYSELDSIIFEFHLESIFGIEKITDEGFESKENELLKHKFRNDMKTLLLELFKDDVITNDNSDYDINNFENNIIPLKK